VHAYPVDPRDAGWEISQPAYRVYFWKQQNEHDPSGWISEEWELRDGDIGEVQAWAHATAEGRLLVIYACVNIDGQIGLIRLSGNEPTAP